MAMLAVFLAVLGGGAFLFGKRRFVEAVLLTRSVCDPLFDLTKPELGRSDIGLGAILNLAMIAAALAFIAGRPNVRLSVPLWVWGPFLAVGLAAVPGAPEPMAALRLWLVLVSHAAFFVLPFYMVDRPQDLVRYFTLMIAASVLPAAYAFVQLALGWAETEDGTRVSGTFSHPNIFAFYLIVVLALALFLLSARSLHVSPKLKRWLTLYVPVLLVLMLLTKTRSAWGATALMMAVFALRLDRRYLVYLMAAPLLVLLVPAIGDRIADLQQGNYNEAYAKLNSYAWRELLWQSSLSWAWERPVFGYGLEAFAYHVAEFFPMPIFGGTIDSHNVYIQLIFEAGAIGLAAFVWMHARILWLLSALIRRGCVEAWMLLAMSACYLLMAYADNMLYYLTPSWYFWFALGCAASALRFTARRPAALPGPGEGWVTARGGAGGGAMPVPPVARRSALDR